MARKYPDRFYGETGRFNYRVGGRFSKPSSNDRDTVLRKIYRFAGEEIAEKLENAVYKASREFMHESVTTGNSDIPQDTKNLLDGTFVIGWYPQSNRNFAVLGPQHFATKPQHWGFNAELETFEAGKGFVRDLWDAETLNETILSDEISDQLSESDNMVAASLVSIAPYALWLEEGTEKVPYYKGWFKRLMQDFLLKLNQRTSAIGLPFDATMAYGVLAQQINYLPFE